eukprot:Gb_13544 [translate_table: standard]
MGFMDLEPELPRCVDNKAGPMSKSVVNGVNFCTAYILGDRERPREIEGPPSRQFLRLLLTSVALMSFAVVVTLSLLNQPPKRSQRLWIGEKEFANAQGFLDKMALQLNSAECNCPCKTINTISKPKGDAHIVDFYVLREHGQPLHIKSIPDFCKMLNESMDFKGFYNSCMIILKSSFESSGWNPYAGKTLYMNSMRTGSLNPVAFMYDVCMSWAGGISQASSSFLISHFKMKQIEAFQLDNFVKGMTTSVRTCAMYTSWPPPNETLYAERANAVDPMLMKMQVAIAIKFNWTDYMEICAPSYCEHLKLNSAPWILFTALAQMGGFLSVAVFALRTIVWPAICLGLGWPTSLTTGSRRLWIDEQEGSTPSLSKSSLLCKSPQDLKFKRSRSFSF